MRKINSKESNDKKKRRNQLIVGGILILVLVLSTIGYSLNSGETNPTESVNYNGVKFVQDTNSGLWDAQIGNSQFSFTYSPIETEKINSSLNPLSNYQDKPLYIYSEDSDATAEIYRNFFDQNQIVQRIQAACIEGETCDPSLPTKNCTDNLIIIEESNSSDSIQQQGNCVFIEGPSENLTELSDSFLLKVIGMQ